MTQKTLNEVIDELKKLTNQEWLVVFSRDLQPVSDFYSWRGAYSEPSCGSGKDILTVRQLTTRLERFVGSVQTGYKGGQFVMRGNSGLWADPYGHYECQGVCGIEENKDTQLVYFHTEKFDW